MIGRTDDDDKAGDHPWHGIEYLHDDADMEDGDEELCDEEHHITDDGCDERSQEYVPPSSEAARSDGECSEAEGETEAHDEAEERHLCFLNLHEIRQYAIHVILDIERESEPSDHRGGDGSEHPFHVERGVMRIEEAVFIEIMGAMLAAVAVFGAVIIILFPALFMHGMFAFDDDLISGLKRRFAQVTGVRYGLVIDAHVRSCIAHDVFVPEDKIADEGHDDLHDEIDEQEDKEAEHDALDEHIDNAVSVHDDGFVQMSEFDSVGECDYQFVGLAVVDVECQSLLITAIDFVIRVDEGELIVREVKMEVIVDLPFECDPVIIAVVLSPIEFAEYIGHALRVILFIHILRIHVDIEGEEGGIGCGASDELFFEMEMLGVVGYVGVIVIRHFGSESDEDATLRILPYSFAFVYLLPIALHRTIEIDIGYVGMLEIGLEDIIGNGERLGNILSFHEGDIEVMLIEYGAHLANVSLDFIELFLRQGSVNEHEHTEVVLEHPFRFDILHRYELWCREPCMPNAVNDFHHFGTYERGVGEIESGSFVREAGGDSKGLVIRREGDVGYLHGGVIGFGSGREDIDVRGVHELHDEVIAGGHYDSEQGYRNVF